MDLYIRFKKIVKHVGPALTILGLLFFISSPLQAAGGHYVQEVRLQGSVLIPEETLLGQLQTKAGRIATREMLNEDIQTLFKKGHFKDIQVEEERGNRGWIYIFVVTEKSMVSRISIEGNKKIKDDSLREVITVPLYQPLQENKVVESIEAMRKLYEEKKYYLVDFDTFLRTTPEGDQELVFTISERKPAVVRFVHFTGNKVFTDEELRAVVKTRKKVALGFLTGAGKYNEEHLKQDVLRLTFHYLKNGYLKVRIGKPTVNLTKDRRYFFITFSIEEGDRYRIGKVGLEGDILTTKEELLASLLTKPDQIYNREFIEKDLQAITKKYADQGYAFVNVQPLTTTDEVQKTADIDYQIEKGNRIFIEKIEITGNTVTRDKVIRRELKVKEGDLYSESKIQESREKVLALGFFKEVNFATPRGDRDDTLHLQISVEERPTGSFSVGAGFSTAEDFILTGSIQKQNFFGLGINGDISAEVSSIRQQFVFSATDPYFLDTEWIFGLSAFRTVFQFGELGGVNFDRESYGGTVSIGHRIFDHSSINFGYQAEEVTAADLASFVPARFQTNASGLTSLVSLTLNRDTRDNRIYPGKGTFNSVKLETSGSKLGGDNDFLRVSARTQFYKPIIRNLVFKTFGRVGYIHSLNSQVVPLFERFYLGGVNSLRGFLPQTVGPKEKVVDTSGNTVNFVFGGNKMIVFNTELEYPVFEPAGLKALVFFDAGNAYGEEEALAFDRFRLNWGVGIRWISPLGPLRFEWGFPINRKSGEQKTVFNFTIGTFF